MLQSAALDPDNLRLQAEFNRQMNMVAEVAEMSLEMRAKEMRQR